MALDTGASVVGNEKAAGLGFCALPGLVGRTVGPSYAAGKAVHSRGSTMGNMAHEASTCRTGVMGIFVDRVIVSMEGVRVTVCLEITSVALCTPVI